MGRYNPTPGESCRWPPPGRAALRLGARSTFLCPRGYRCPDRTQTTALSAATLGMLPCPIGTYQDQPGQTECTPCPAGSSTAQIASRSATACQRGGPPLSSATIRATASVLLVLSTHLPWPKAHFGVHDCPTMSSGCPMTTSSLSRPHRHAARVNAALLARDIREPTMHCRSLTAAASRQGPGRLDKAQIVGAM